MGNCYNSSMSKTLFHQQLGHLEKQYHQNYSIEYFKSTIKLTSRQKYQKWASQVKKMRFNTQTKDILYIPQKMMIRQSDIFEKQTLIEVFYEPYIETLQDLIARYKNKHFCPSQEMVWYLIYTLTKVGKYFEKVNRKIGFVTPSNIVVSPNRQFKVICQKSTLQFISPMEQIKLKLSDKALLAPQEIQYLNKTQRKNPEIQINPQISEVFSIGILVLACANLIEPHKLYNYHCEMPNNISIDYNKVQTLFEGLKRNKRFSDLLVQTIREMIEIKPEKRIKSTQLFKRLSEYEIQILNKKGLNYSGQEIQRIKESLNASFMSRTLNNSVLTNGNKSFQNNTLSFRVSDISQAADQKNSTEGRRQPNNRNNAEQNFDFINIL